jgi:hypothetical protein
VVWGASVGGGPLSVSVFSEIECASGHVTLLTAQMLATAGVAADQKLVDLSARLRCPATANMPRS